MATQRIRFAGPPGETITLDIWNTEFPTSGASPTHANIVCIEQTAGDYLTNTFTGTLAGRCKISKKISGASFGIDFVTMINATATYIAESLKAAEALLTAEDIKILLNAVAGNNDVAPYSGGYYTIQVKDVDDATILRTLRYNPTTGDKYIVTS